jgi:DNA-binding MarR family transcriptional regulator
MLLEEGRAEIERMPESAMILEGVALARLFLEKLEKLTDEERSTLFRIIALAAAPPMFKVSRP